MNKALQLNNLKHRTAMNEKTLLFVICVEAIIYLLLYSLHDCTFKSADISVRRFARLTENERLLPSTKSCGKM